MDLEQLALKTLWALVRFENPYLLTRMSTAKDESDVETGISDTAFAIARCMAEQR